MTATYTLADDSRFDAVRRRRMLAFLVDFTIVALLSLAVGVLVFFLGVITLGLAWLLYGGIFPVVAILYSGMTVGGEHSATVGMRAAGLITRRESGGRPDFIQGAAHVILFYVSISFLTPLILLVSLFNSRKRMLHDMLVGITVENAMLRLN
jgi:uncharacterized RDD family membrane protein YckC